MHDGRVGMRGMGDEGDEKGVWYWMKLVVLVYNSGKTEDVMRILN